MEDEEDRPRNHRKDRQLCKQVFQALSMELACMQYRPWARDMYIERVEPAPDASRLLVSISFFTPRDPSGASDALARLRRMTASMRQEVAAAICRKKTPELLFDLAARVED